MENGVTLISVIVPIYNTDKYLDKCIKSIIQQTWTNLQIILVDDGSSDSSGEICDKYASMDSRIQVIHQKNSGVSAARNKGLQNAVGKYIAFVDADDFLPADAYENLMNAWMPESQLVMGRIRCIREDGEPLKESRKFNLRKTTVEEFQMDLFEETTFSYLGFPWDKLYVLDLIKKHNLEFNPSIVLNEDRLFIFQYLQFCRNVSFCDATVYFYRQRGSDIMTEAGRRIIVTENEMTVLNAFRQMQKISFEKSEKLYYVCSRKALESALDLLNRVPRSDKAKRKRLKIFLRENTRICLGNPDYGVKDRLKIFFHYIFCK